MIAIISPARNVRPVAHNTIKTTRPLFAKEAAQLAGYLRAYSPWQLESLLDVPPERAFNLYDAYQNFNRQKEVGPALLAYYGAAYRNMAPQTFTAAQLTFAQEHLRILSALYGMLRPSNGIVNHRLGLKKDFSPEGNNLYAFWGGKIFKELYQQTDFVVNLASLEYAKLITPFMPPGNKMLTCRFLVEKPGGARGTVATVRAARGMMAGYIVRNRIANPQHLKEFDDDGYEFAPNRSTPHEYVFIQRKKLYG